MIEALWIVSFLADTQSAGAGVIIFESGRIFGGDTSFFWTGSYQSEGGRLSGKIHVKRHSPGLASVFPGLDEYEMEVSGTMAPQNMQLIGAITGSDDPQMVFALRRAAELP